MIDYTSDILRHEAEHFDELVKKFTDLKIRIDGTTSYYYSDQILPHINNTVFFQDTSMFGTGDLHSAHLSLKVDDCATCGSIYGAPEFLINTYSSPIRVCQLRDTGDGLTLASFSYEDTLTELKVPLRIVNDLDLYVLNMIKERQDIKCLQVNNRIRKLLSFL